MIGPMILQLLAETIGRALTTGALEWGMIWAAERLAASTESTADDEFVADVKKKLGWGDGEKA